MRVARRKRRIFTAAAFVHVSLDLRLEVRTMSSVPTLRVCAPPEDKLILRESVERDSNAAPTCAHPTFCVLFHVITIHFTNF